MVFSCRVGRVTGWVDATLLVGQAVCQFDKA
jgi:hypothetical protein